MRPSVLVITLLWTSRSLLGSSSSLDERFELATEELITFSENKAVIEPIAPLPRDVKGLTKRLRERAVKETRKVRLIYYEKGQPRTEATRRALLPTIAIELVAKADPIAIAHSLDVDYRGPLKSSANIYLFEIKDYASIISLIGRFSVENSVLAVWPQLGRIHTKHFLPNDSYFSDQWHLLKTEPNGVDINAPTAWDMATGKGIRIGIVDDGVQLTHPDLLGNINPNLHYDFIRDDTNPEIDLLVPDADDGHPSGEDSHGTLVAGIAAAKGNNGTGVTGVAPDASIVAMRLIGGYTSDAMEAQAFLHEMDDIQIKNNSWGPPGFGDVYSGPDPLAKAALEQAAIEGRQGRGTIFVWSCGNGGEKADNANKDGYANSPFTIAVGAVNENGYQSAYSEMGSNLLVSAPSSGRATRGLYSTDLLGNDGNNNDTRGSDLEDRNYSRNFGGTSGSAPIVAGVTALMLEVNPSLNWRDVQEILMRTAQKNDATDPDWFTNAAIPPMSFNLKYGSGLVDADAAVTAAQSWMSLPPRKELSQRPSVALPVDIPDDPNSPASLTFSVGGSGLRLEHVQVRLSISHGRRGDLEIELESPNGTVSQLLAHTVFDEEANILDFTFMTLHFWGEAGDGLWKLRVKDQRNRFNGEIHQATITLNGTETAGIATPYKPSQLTIRRSSILDANLAWQDNSNDETGFRIERCNDFDQPWELIDTVASNVNSYHDQYFDGSQSYIYRICSIKGSLQSSYTEPVDSYRPWTESEELLYVNFDSSQGYQSSQNIQGQNRWETIGGQNARIVSNQFPALGNQLRVGGYGFDGAELYNSAYKIAPYFPQGNSQARFKCKLSIKSNGDPIDNFGFSFYGTEGEFLFAIDFDAFFEKIQYFNDDFTPKDLNRTYSLELIHDLEIVFNFSNNTWSAVLDGRSIASSAKIANNPASEETIGLYYIEPYYSIHDQNAPGSNYMLVDELRLEQFAVDTPSPPSELEVSAFSSSTMLLQWLDAFLAESYHIERRATGSGNWEEIETITVDGWPYFYVDTGLSPTTHYDYRVRARNSFGFSDYTNLSNGQTENQYQDWLARNDIEKSTPPQTLVEGTNYSLLQAYALGLSAEKFSASSSPQIKVDNENQLITLTYYKSRDDVDYTVQRRFPSDGQGTSTGVTQTHSQKGRFVTAAIPVTVGDVHLLRIHLNLKQ